MEKKEMFALGAFVGLCALAMYEGVAESETTFRSFSDRRSLRATGKSQALKGGIGDETDDDDVDEYELEMGEDVEMEHTDDPNVAHEIALDHLTEDEHYYTHLKEMEKKYKKS
ncbi:MAG: hypothetical protein H7836_04360 [Magnetococcus sp. YQC-3]